MAQPDSTPLLSRRRWVRPYALAPVVLAAAVLVPLPSQAQPLRAVTETTSFTYMKDGKPAGVAVDVVEQVLRLAGVADYRIGVYPWARAYDMALAEPNVMIFMLARTPEREPKFQWVGQFMQMQFHLYKLRERTEVAVRDLEGAKAHAIGVMRDDVRQAYLQKRGFTRLVVSAQPAENFDKLMNRQVDLIPLTDPDLAAQCRESRVDCQRIEKVLTLDELTTSLYLAFSNATPRPAVDRLRAAFGRLEADGTVQWVMQQKMPATAAAVPALAAPAVPAARPAAKARTATP